MEPQNSSKKFIGIIVGMIVLAGVAAVSFLGGKEKTEVVIDDQSSDVVPQNPVTETPVTSTPSTKPKPVATTVYKDGTYTANGSYMSPGGKDTISVKITIKNDIITSSSVSVVSADNTSKGYINEFISGYKQYVVGKNISSVSVSKISGSSLTPEGFNSALKSIKTQAKA